MPGEQSPIKGSDMHRECGMRCIIGSVGHLKGRCSCYGGMESDPPEMTLREAAKAAIALWQKIQNQPNQNHLCDERQNRIFP